MAKAMQEKGGAKWGISLGTKNSQEYCPFLWSNGGDVIDARASSRSTAAGGRGADLLRLVLQGGPDPEVRARGLRHHAGVRVRHAPDVLLRPVALSLIKKAGGADFDSKWAVVPIPKKVSSTSWVGGSNVVVFKDSKNKDLA
jgi:multiple sugar transport system substrate-binding protein